MSISDLNTPLRSELASDPDMVELIELFLSELPARLAAFEDAAKGGQADSLRRLAHQMRGAAAGYGYSSIGKAAGAVEDRIRQLGSEPGPSAVEKVRDEMNALSTLCRRALMKK
jgi:HPt (histidine-containing phosphotransfer) domain-containing protein